MKQRMWRNERGVMTLLDNGRTARLSIVADNGRQIYWREYVYYERYRAENDAELLAALADMVEEVACEQAS